MQYCRLGDKRTGSWGLYATSHGSLQQTPTCPYEGKQRQNANVDRKQVALTLSDISRTSIWVPQAPSYPAGAWNSDRQDANT